jgi:hypothetical protein
LTKDQHTILFDIIIPTNKGLLFAIYFWHETKIVGAMTDVSKQRMMVNEAQEKFGHADQAATRKAAKVQDDKNLQGKMKPREACTVRKAK